MATFVAESNSTVANAVTVAGADAVAAARRRFDDFKPKTPDPNLRRELKHGWLLPNLLFLDECLWGRWDYWALCYQADALPPEPIPRLGFLDFPHVATRRMLEASLDCIPQHGSWRTWGGWSYFDYFLSWLLFSFGHKGQNALPAEPAGCTGASSRLYQVFALDAMLLWPHDYWGALLAESSYGKTQGFYPTPHHICEFMAQMACDGKKDMRAETVLDPCVGTGRMLLHASNHSLRLYGMDIDPTLCKATLVNGYLYAPWLVRPLPWLDAGLAALEQMPQNGDGSGVSGAQELSDCMAASAPPQAHEYLQETEHDPEEQPILAPLLKRRKKRAVDPTQGTLF
jgi:hypothetical protein